ncbi:cell shape-determining protein MreB [Spirosoma sp. HMF4905]|uniref:Cell shape-determining protein MreB n=1 Tax=Spirosoma arboris TaxID=2682092 RepID=A0A7K1S9F7_9BACT|nr:IPT/TIG domain-containing protein [Spirosoma arboris]MVM30447.1 cell shape-determining protein MreB [Spirosoma arboris]
MKTVKHLLTMLLLLSGLAAVIVACKKNPDEPTPVIKPTPKTTIASVDPATAPVGSTIAITGTNFSTDPGSNTITIGGVTATVVSATDTRLVVVVPAGATSGPVSVTAGGQTAQAPGTFTVSLPAVKPVKEVSGTTFANLNWKKDTIYLLRGLVYIPANYTLTIEAGTIIKGAGPERDPTSTNHAGALIIEKRGKLIAQGTATQPIVFTSAKAVGQRNYGDWGGLVLIGKAPVNQLGTTLYPNGIRGTVETYGEPLDNSGTLQYVRIEYAGAVQPTTPVTRLSGLSLYGVGSGTVIDHIQVSYSGSDGFSWFGGSANLKNLFSYRSFDDDWSVDWGYVGNVQFGVALRDPDVADQSGSNGFEVENFTPTETADVTAVVLVNGLTQNAPVFANVSNFAFNTTPTANNTAKGTGGYQSGIYLRRNSAISIYNSIVYGYPVGLTLDGSGAGLTSGTIDLKGVVVANVLTPVVGVGGISADQATAYFTVAGRSNQIVQTSDMASLLLNGANFSLTAPNFLPQVLSPLLGSGTTGGKLTNSFFTQVAYRGAFGSDNWTSGWINIDPQNKDYDR